MTVRLVVLLGFVVLLAGSVRAQETPTDSLAVPSDSTRFVPPDPLVAPPQRDTVVTDVRSYPMAPPADGGLDQPVTYTARDSLVIRFGRRDSLDGGASRDQALLFGSVTAQYAEAELTADRLELLFGEQLIRALPTASDSGLVGVPRFAEGSESFTGREVVYNLRTRRGRVVGARTEIEDGYLIGGIIKQRDAHVIYAADAGYTTCSLDHPHYALTAGRMKIVDGERIYTGPVQLRLLGIPMPLWLPFGYFPAAEGRRSGPLAISYGEDRDAYGFYLENLGWYWAISDYVDAQVSGKVGTRGSFQLQSRFNYVRRYRYDGTLDLSYARLRSGERPDPDFSLRNDVTVGWRHVQTFDPTASLNASVNLRSSISPLLADDYDTRVSQTSTSTIALRKSWPRAGRSVNLDLRAVQTLSTGAADLTLPSLSFAQQRRFPFRRTARAGRDEAWYEKIGLSYAGSLTNRYRFEPLADSVVSEPFQDVSWVDGLFDYEGFAGRTGSAERFVPEVRHELPVTAAFSMERLPVVGVPFRLNWSPSLRYQESWYASAQQRVLIDSTLQTLRDPGFTAIRRVTLGVSANTEFYGLFPWRLGPLNGFRHIVKPQVSFSYEPDYSAAPFNYYRTVTDAAGTEVEYPLIAGIPNRRTQRLAFSLGNVFQTRHVRADSTGEEQRRIIDLFTFDARAAYDFAAEERPFGDVSLNLTSQFDRFRLQVDGALSPYALDSLGVISATSYFEDTGRLLRLTRFGLSTGTSFQAGGGARPSGLPPGTGSYRPLGYDPTRPDYGLQPDGYVDFAVPWSVSLGFTYGFMPATRPDADATTSAVLEVTSFDFSLTPTWKIAGRTGYDFVGRDLSTTTLSVVRDLHCWEMRFNWTPFGLYKSFSFSIYVKSGQLRDLLRLDVPRSTSGGRFGSGF